MLGLILTWMRTFGCPMVKLSTIVTPRSTLELFDVDLGILMSVFLAVVRGCFAGSSKES